MLRASWNKWCWENNYFQARSFFSLSSVLANQILYVLIKVIFSTARILTGDEICTSGSALLLKKDLVSDRKEFLRMIGYCPQFDSIIDVLTGREMLVLLSKLRGIKNSTEEANRWLKALGKGLFKSL